MGKTDSACRAADIFLKFIILCAILLSVIVLYQNIEVVITAGTLIVFAYLAIITAVIGFMLYLAKFNMPEKLYIMSILIISLIPRLCFIILVQTPVSGDFLLMYNAAEGIISGDRTWIDIPFFSNWGYLIPFVYYEALILKLFGADSALKLLNVAFMVITNLMIYLLARECTNSRAAFISAVLYSVYPAPILLSSVLTNQHISLMFFLLSMYFYIVNRSWAGVLLSGLFLFLGNLMRPEAVLILAAMIVHTLLSLCADFNVKVALSKMLLILVVFVVLTGLSSVLFKATGAAPYGISNNCPEWKFVLGLDTGSNGTYTDKNSYIISIKDPNQRFNEAKKLISASLRECKNIPLFLWEKTKSMWANMESASWSLMHIQKDRPFWEKTGDLTYEQAINHIIYFDKSIYILLHILFTAACILLWMPPVSAKHRACFFIALVLVNYMTYVFIEIQTRYRYFIMPSFFIAASVVYELITKYIGKGTLSGTLENKN